MKQFNLEEYLANPSRKIITRDGRSARIICTDAKIAYGEGECPIIALIQKDEKYEELPYAFQKNGSYFQCKTDDKDLFFAPEKHEGWVNLLKDFNGNAFIDDSGIYELKEEAEKAMEYCSNYMTAIKIEWEE